MLQLTGPLNVLSPILLRRFHFASVSDLRGIWIPVPPWWSMVIQIHSLACAAFPGAQAEIIVHPKRITLRHLADLSGNAGVKKFLFVNVHI
jgi:hypothetical protein